MQTITQARITAMPQRIFDPMPTVVATYQDGHEEVLFEYYPDELSFTPQEFLGLTRAQAHHLKYEKDLRYLQS